MAAKYLLEWRGRVEAGQRLGRRLGVPTANLALPRAAGHLRGTFAAVVDGVGARRHAVAHVGVRPSVEAGGAPVLEVHLLDFAGDLYGRELTVRLEHKVADEVRLESLEVLAAKIARDVGLVRAYFATRNEHAGPFARRRMSSRTASRP